MCPFVFAVQIVTAKNKRFLEVSEPGIRRLLLLFKSFGILPLVQQGCDFMLGSKCEWPTLCQRGSHTSFFVLIGSIAKIGKSKTMQKSLCLKGEISWGKKMVLTLHLLCCSPLAVMCHDWFWCRCKREQRNGSNTFFKTPGLPGFHSDTVRCQVSADHA